jgi:hypothetical protein
VTFLRARREPATKRFWIALAGDHRGAPAALQELARGDSSVVCDPAEASESLRWARAHVAWIDDPAPVWIATE